nr:MAG TPA: hypothetical protein [Caudoviricetes sp.]
MGNGPPTYLLKDHSCISITSLRPPRHSPTSRARQNRPSFTSATTA